jgi:hypothetical protein
VPGITELGHRYDVTLTVDRDGSQLPNPAEFAAAAGQASSARAASIVTAHVFLCKDCGRRRREQDRYYGRDHRPGDSILFGPDGRRLW